MMSLKRSIFIFTLLCISLCSTKEINAMEAATGLTELEEEMEEGQQDALGKPPINIPDPKLLSGPNVFDASLYSIATAGLYTFGALLVAYDHSGWLMPTISSLLLAGGVATNAYLVKFCIAKKREHTSDVAELAAYKPFAQQAIINHSRLPWHLRLPDNVVNRIYEASKCINAPALLSELLCHLEPDRTDWSAAEEEQQFAAFLETARTIVDSLPAQLEEQRLREEEQLPVSQEMLHTTLAQAVTNNAMKVATANYPLKFFNRYYRTECPAEKKGPFAESIAAAATDVHVNNVLSLVQPGKLTDLNKREILVTARNAYFHKITALPNPT